MGAYIMAFEQKQNSGALFKNNKKETDKHADYNGSLNVDGTEYWINAWIKEAKSGVKYMSLSVQPKEKKYEENNIPEVALPHDDVPF